MTNKKDTPNFFLGLPVYFRGICSIHPPTVKDVIELGKDFLVYRTILTFSQEEVEDSLKKDNPDIELEEAAPTPLEFLLANCYFSEEVKKKTEDSFRFFIREPVRFDYENRKIMLVGNIEDIDDITEIRMLDEENFFDFQNLIRNAIGEEDVEAPDLDEDIRVKRIKMKGRLRDKVKAEKGLGLTLKTSLASLCCMGISLNPLNIGEISYCSVNVLMNTYQEKHKYETDISSLIAGADPKKVKPKYWIRNLN